MSDPLIIDIHAYLGRDSYGDTPRVPMNSSRRWNESGIDVAVVAPLVDSPGPAPRAHQALEEARQRHPQRLIPLLATSATLRRQ